MEAINKCGHVAATNLCISSAEAALTIATHRIHIAAITLHENCVLLTAAHISHHDVEAAYFGQIVDHFFAAHAKLAVVIIYKEYRLKSNDNSLLTAPDIELGDGLVLATQLQAFVKALRFTDTILVVLSLHLLVLYSNKI